MRASRGLGGASFVAVSFSPDVPAALSAALDELGGPPQPASAAAPNRTASSDNKHPRPKGYFLHNLQAGEQGFEP